MIPTNLFRKYWAIAAIILLIVVIWRAHFIWTHSDAYHIRQIKSELGQIGPQMTDPIAQTQTALTFANDGVFDIAFRIIGNIDDDNYQADACQTVAAVIVAADQVPHGLNMVCRIPGSSLKNKALSAIVREVCRVDGVTTAQELIGILELPGDQAVALQALVSHEIANGHLLVAAELAQAIPEDFIRIQSLTQLAAAWANSDGSKSNRLLEEAISLAGKLSHPFLRINCLHQIAQTQFHLGRIEAAETILNKVIIATEMMPEGLDQSLTRSYLVPTLIEQGYRERAIEVWHGIHHSLPQKEALAFLVDSVKSTSDLDPLKKLVSELPLRTDQVEILGRIALAWGRLNEPGLALAAIMESAELSRQDDCHLAAARRFCGFSHQCRTLGLTTSARYALHTAFDHAWQAENGVDTVRVLTDIARGFWSLDDLWDCQMTLGRADEMTRHMADKLARAEAQVVVAAGFNRLANTARANELLIGAYEICQEMPASDARNQLLRQVATQLWDSGESGLAKEIAAQVVDPDEDNYFQAIEAALAEHWILAHEAANSITSQEKRADALGRILTIWAKS